MIAASQATGRSPRQGRAAGRRVPRPGRAAPRAAGRRVRAPARTRWVVAGVALGGTVTAAAVTAWASPGHRLGESMLSLGPLPGAALPVALLVLTCVVELVAVRLRHADTVEELTLLDAMVLVNVLLLPTRQALAVTLCGLLAAYLWRRRNVLKVLFNLGTYAAGASVMALAVRLTGPTATPDLALLCAMALGTTAFVVVNLVTMSLLLWTFGAFSPRQFLRQDVRLAAFTVVGTVALAATTVTMAIHSPLLLPCSVLPAAAMVYAYRATAIEAEERQRSARVLAFSQLLASAPARDDALAAFLALARDEFSADRVVAIVDGDDAVLSVTGEDPQPRSVSRGPQHDALLRACAHGASVHEGLEGEWSSALIAPLVSGGRHLGTVAVGRRRGRLRARDVTSVAPLASALAAALENAEHLQLLVEESSKLRAVVDQSSDGILVLDGHGVVQLWNPALTALTGRDEATALGARLGELIEAEGAGGERVDAFALGRELLSPQQPRAVLDLEIVRPDGERRSVRCAHAAAFDGAELVRDVVILHDLTAERQAERLKSDFVATVSHELRTPLTPIKGYADLLRRRGEDMPADKRAKALDVIIDRAAHLGRLVEDLLLTSSMSAGREPARSVVTGTADLAGIATRALEDFDAATDRLSLTATGEPVTVACDAVRAVQVLTNLVSNALKYSPDGSAVDVVVDSCDGHGRVTVTDHGRGIPADQLERVFEKFHRVEDPMVMSTSGTGLGLFIARHLARAMGGDLTLTSTLGVGSRFTLTLPLAPVGTAAASEVPAQRSGPPSWQPPDRRPGRTGPPLTR